MYKWRRVRASPSILYSRTGLFFPNRFEVVGSRYLLGSKGGVSVRKARGPALPQPHSRKSADPGVRRVGAIGTESNAGLGLGKLYGGRGLGTKVATTWQLWCPESVVL